MCVSHSLTNTVASDLEISSDLKMKSVSPHHLFDYLYFTSKIKSKLWLLKHISTN